MPEIITGRAHSGNIELLFERIKTAAADKQVTVIVPDQFSFEADKQLYELLGARTFNSIETAGIAALAEKIGREHGSSGLAPANDNAKLIAMYRAQSKLKSGGLSVFSKSLMRPKFVHDCIELSAQLTRSGADAAEIRASAEIDSSVTLRLKDLSTVIEAYKNELSEMALRDNISEMAYAAELVRENKLFKGRTVFFYAFNSFSKDELQFVGSVIRNAASVTFEFLHDEVKNGTDPFRDTLRTIEDIRRISADQNRSVTITHVEGVYQSEPTKHINLGYFGFDTQKAPHDGLVTVAAASDIYEECDYICAKICELVGDKERGLEFSDIAVICGSLEEDRRILSSAAEKYEIPCFVDLPDTALRSIPGRYLMSILDACSGRTYKTEKVLRLIKSPLSFFHYYDALDIEEYCLTWGIDGDMWKSSFERGDGKPFKKRIDETRSRIIGPLEKFRNAVQNTTADGICKALYELLDELEMSKQIYSRLQRAPEGSETDLEVVRGFKQVWTGMTEAIKSIYRDMSGQKMSLREFTELITLMLDSIKLANPPQKNNCLRIGSADHSVMSGVKVLFIMHANEGVFPPEVSSDSLLTDKDLAALAKKNIMLEISPNIQLDKIRFGLYSAITLPSEQLIVTYSDFGRTGDSLLPSSLPNTLLSIFKGLETVRISDLPLSFFCTTYETALSTYLEHYKDNTPETAAIRKVLDSNDEKRRELQFIENSAKKPNDKLSKDTAEKLFLKDGDLHLSSTRINTYFKCPFSYFCTYGLRMSTAEKIDVDQLHIGSIAHKCLETVMSVEKNGKRVYDTGFIARTDEELLKMVSDCTDKYVAENMGGGFGKNRAFRFALDRVKKSIRDMAVNFREELKNSGFIPVAFEYSLTGEDGLPVMTVSVDKDTLIKLSGSIDRVDLFQTEEAAWIRIVDYKTGKQTFKLSEVYHGLDLQMLIYLLAVTTGSSDIGKGGKLPAGIMYSHIKSVPPDLSPADTDKLASDPDALEALLRDTRSKTYKPEGLMVGEVMNALNTDKKGIYTIFKLDAKGNPTKASSQPVDKDRLIAIEEYALEKMIEMGQRLKKGDITADPIRTFDSNDAHPEKGKLPCSYCAHRAVCRSADPVEPKTAWNSDEEKLNELLDEKVSQKRKENSGLPT